MTTIPAETATEAPASAHTEIASEPAGGVGPAPATEPQGEPLSVTPPAFPCGVGDCPEVLPTALRAGRHRLDAHGIRGTSAKKKTRKATRVPPPQRPAVDRSARGAPDPAATPPPSGLTLPTSPEAHKKKVAETKAWLQGTGNDWMVKGHKWLLCPNIPEQAFEPGFRLQLTGPDGKTVDLSLYEQVTFQGWQLDVLAESYVRVDDSPLGKALKEWVEKNGGTLFLLAGGAVLLMHVVGLWQLRQAANEIGKARKAVEEQAAAAAAEGQAAAPSTLLSDLMANPEAMKAAAKMAENMGIKIPGMSNGAEPAGEGAEQVA